MLEAQTIEVLKGDQLQGRVKTLFDDGNRLVQVGCSRLADSLQVNYSFDKKYAFLTLRVNLSLSDARLPSISGIYAGAFIYENEIHDLFGINFEHMNVDYKGTFYKLARPTPFNPAQETGTKDQT